MTAVSRSQALEQQKARQYLSVKKSRDPQFLPAKFCFQLNAKENSNLTDEHKHVASLAITQK